MKDLRKGRLDVDPHYFSVDMPFYREHIEGFLPDRITDIHAHVGTRKGIDPKVDPPTFWPQWVTCGHDMTVQSLLDAYVKLLPGKEVNVVCFGSPRRDNLQRANRHVSEMLKTYPNIRGFALTLPEWTPETLEKNMDEGGFCGLKSYASMVKDKPGGEVTILDIYPHGQLETAERRGWPVMLHVPRAGRLADRANIDQLHEICRLYPALKLIIAHVGRSYWPEAGRKGLAALKDLDMLYYDISANTCRPVFECLIETAGPERILYGSDLPIFAVRGRRIWEDENYINYIYRADWEDEHTRRCPEAEEKLTFMLYEEILAFRQAAENKGLTRGDIGNIFHNNAQRLLEGV